MYGFRPGVGTSFKMLLKLLDIDGVVLRVELMVTAEEVTVDETCTREGCIPLLKISEVTKAGKMVVFEGIFTGVFVAICFDVLAFLVVYISYTKVV